MADYFYKLLRAEEWHAFEANGSFGGSADDHRDGFIHLSLADQVAGTAAKYFKNVSPLFLVILSVKKLRQEQLKMEPSRGGALFPHYYGSLEARHIVKTITLGADHGPLDRLSEDLLLEHTRS